MGERGLASGNTDEWLQLATVLEIETCKKEENRRKKEERGVRKNKTT
jgi:hypothetical protein